MDDTIYAIVAISPDEGLVDYAEEVEDKLWLATLDPSTPKMYFTCIPINELIH